MEVAENHASHLQQQLNSPEKAGYFFPWDEYPKV